MDFICNLTRISCRSSWCILTCCLTTWTRFIQIWTNFEICIWGLTGIVICCFLDWKVLSCCFGQIVFETCIESLCWTVAPFWACSIWNLLRIACSFIMSCWILVLSVLAWCSNAFCISAMYNLCCSYLLGRSSLLNELYM